MALNIENYLPGVRDAGNPGIATNETLTVGTNATISQTSASFVQPLNYTGNVVNLSTATTLTSGQSGSLVLFNSATGFTITLPVPTSGLNYEFFILQPTTSTGGTHAIITNSTGTVYLQGSITMSQAVGTSSVFLATTTSAAGVRFNNASTGGSIGTYLQMTAVSTTTWAVIGYGSGQPAISNPFYSG